MDLIERLSALALLCEDCKSKYHGECPHPACRCIEYRAISKIPEVDAEPVKHGSWIFSAEDVNWIYEGNIPNKMWCSACGSMYGSEGYGFAYCPCCGAIMDGVAKYANDR